jgi:hypothetical protein
LPSEVRVNMVYELASVTVRSGSGNLNLGMSQQEAKKLSAHVTGSA